MMQKGIRCEICGRMTAKVRDCEVRTAYITGRAHVDCVGHSQYRSVRRYELPPLPPGSKLLPLSKFGDER
jgi:hypothetical protein